LLPLLLLLLLPQRLQPHPSAFGAAHCTPAQSLQQTPVCLRLHLLLPSLRASQRLLLLLMQSSEALPQHTPQLLLRQSQLRLQLLRLKGLVQIQHLLQLQQLPRQT
jgi:hypothetical protein